MARTSAPLAPTTSHRTLGTTDFPRAQLYTYYTLLVHYRHRAAKFNAATAERYIPPYILYNNPLTSWGIQQVAARGSRCTVKIPFTCIYTYACTTAAHYAFICIAGEEAAGFQVAPAAHLHARYISISNRRARASIQLTRGRFPHYISDSAGGFCGVLD